MKRKTKIILAIIVFILIFSIVTNPSYTKFENFSKEIPKEGIYINTKETFNGFVYSIYTKEIAHTYSLYGEENIIGYKETIEYCGIFSNFFEISRTKDDKHHDAIK